MHHLKYRPYTVTTTLTTVPLTLHYDEDPEFSAGLALLHVQDAGELEQEEEGGVKCLVLPHTERPDINVAVSFAVSLQVLKTAQTQEYECT